MMTELLYISHECHNNGSNLFPYSLSIKYYHEIFNQLFIYNEDFKLVLIQDLLFLITTT